MSRARQKADATLTARIDARGEAEVQFPFRPELTRRSDAEELWAEPVAEDALLLHAPAGTALRLAPVAREVMAAARDAGTLSLVEVHEGQPVRYSRARVSVLGAGR